MSVPVLKYTFYYNLFADHAKNIRRNFIKYSDYIAACTGFAGSACCQFDIRLFVSHTNFANIFHLFRLRFSTLAFLVLTIVYFFRNDMLKILQVQRFISIYTHICTIHCVYFEEAAEASSTQRYQNYLIDYYY